MRPSHETSRHPATARARTATVVLAHGAFADSSSWDGVVSILQGRGHHAISVAVPLRGVASDARYLSDVVRTVDGPVVLVGHSYGGAVISNTDRDAADIRFIWGQVDYNTPAQAHAFMARGAGARTATEVAGASHVVGISHPRRTAAVISRATNAAVHSRRPS